MHRSNLTMAASDGMTMHRYAPMEASVAIHPTIAEEFVTFGGWGQQQQGDKVRIAEMSWTRKGDKEGCMNSVNVGIFAWERRENMEKLIDRWVRRM